VKAERTWFLGEGEEALAKERAHGSFTRQAFLVISPESRKIRSAYPLWGGIQDFPELDQG
jgi:hypothetical protein